MSSYTTGLAIYANSSSSSLQIAVKSSIYRMSDHGIHGDEALVWGDPRQQMYPTVHPTVHSESDVSCTKPFISSPTATQITEVV